jgi:hypothetical protein
VVVGPKSNDGCSFEREREREREREENTWEINDSHEDSQRME